MARTLDGESVRIAKDVLRAGADSMKICLPESVAEWERMLLHRGRRRPVVVGGDTALLRTVRILHREGGAASSPVSFVPVGTRTALGLARHFGVPQSAVAAARTVLDGVERSLDVLVDDGGGIVVGGLRIPGAVPAPRGQPEATPRRWLDGARAVLRALAPPDDPRRPPAGHRLRVEADGVLLAEPERPVHEVCVPTPANGLASVYVRRPAPGGPAPRPVRVHQLTVSGQDFRYRADEAVAGPVRTRTWHVEPAAWRLTVPGQLGIR